MSARHNLAWTVVTVTLSTATMTLAAGHNAYSQQAPAPPIVYVGPTGALFLIDADGTNQLPIFPLLQVDLLGPRWSRDGSLISAWGNVPSNLQGAQQLFTFDRAGGHLTQVTDLFPDVNASSGWTVATLSSAFSPSGDTIAVAVQFLSVQSGARYGAFLTYASNGAGWIPTIVYPQFPVDELYNLWGLDWAPRTNLVITPIETNFVCPAGSPGDGLIATPTEIFAAAPLSNAPRTQITTSSGPATCAVSPFLTPQFFAALPVFSPNGSQIAYAQFAYLEGSIVQSALRIVNLDGTNDHVVAVLSQQWLSGVDWSPDGTQLIYGPVPLVNGTPDITRATVAIIDTNGTGARQLVGPPAGGAAWSRQFPVPAVGSLAPQQTSAGGAGFTLTVRGSNFAPASSVQWNGVNRATTFDSTTNLHAAILASDLVQPGAVQVTVSNPPPGGGVSTPVGFTITPAAAPGVALSANSVTFPPQLVGTTSAPQLVTLTNSGTAQLTVTAISITTKDGASGSFAETDHCVGNIAVGASCSLSVTFKASGVGAASGTVAVNDNAANAPQAIGLAATGADFSFASAPGGATTATIPAGGTATYNLAVQPSGYSGTVALTCSGAPPTTTCSVAPANLDVSPGSAAPFTVTVTTAARSQLAAAATGQPLAATRLPWPAALLLLSALVAMLVVRDGAPRPLRACLLVAVPFSLAVVVAHCGSSAGPTQPSVGTPAGNYTLVVTGSSGGVTRTINLTLQVN